MVNELENEMPTLECTGKKLIVTMEDGRKAMRSTANHYKAAIVGTYPDGKFVILSAHWTIESAGSTVATVKSGKFVNHNYTRAGGAKGSYEIVT